MLATGGTSFDPSCVNGARGRGCSGTALGGLLAKGGDGFVNWLGHKVVVLSGCSGGGAEKV